MTTFSESSRRPTKGWRADPRDLTRSCIRFGRLLRHNGIPVTPDRVARWLKALDILGCEHPADLFWSGRVNLVSAYAHLSRYDDLFRQFWLTLDHAALDPLSGTQSSAVSRGAPLRASLNDLNERESLAGKGDEEGDGPTGEGGGSQGESRKPSRRWQVGDPYSPPGSSKESSADISPVPGLYSDLEILREKDFAAYTRNDETRLMQLLQANPDWLRPLMRSRRTRPQVRGPLIDMRRTVSAGVRSGGDPVRLLWRAPSLRWRKWVFLCDISASMAPYTRALLLFLQVVASRRRASEVFLFGTRLTRITPQLRRNRTDQLEAFLQNVRDWHGGTRLGESLDRFQRQYGQRGMAHGAVVFILSDGLDQGESGQVAEAMRRLDRVAQRIVWVNPLKRSSTYQPLAQGMSEALPYLDDFVSGHSLVSLVDLIGCQVRLER